MSAEQGQAVVAPQQVVLSGPPPLSWGGGVSLCPGIHRPKPGKGPRISKLLPLRFQFLSAAWKRVGQEQGEGGVFLWLPVRFLVSSTAKADGTWRKEQNSRMQRFISRLGAERLGCECG